MRLEVQCEDAAMPTYRLSDLNLYQPEPTNWCTRCQVHSAAGVLCPVCVDEADKAMERRIASARTLKMASMCRG